MEENVQFESDGLLLAGTLQFPQNNPPYPACLLLGGSGPQLRDGSFDYSREDFFPTALFQRPILDIEARRLAQLGIASLRYDKRGSGESEGEISDASFSELVDDAEAALNFLAGRPDLDSTKIGIVGQSEGAVVGLILASRVHTLAFYVWQSGFVDSIEQIGKLQQRDVESMPPELADEMKSVAPYFYWEAISQSEIFEAVRLERERFTLGDENWSLDLNLGYYRDLMATDLLQSITRIRCPVLIVHGEADDIVPMSNAQDAYQALTTEDKDDVSLMLLPEIGHSLNRVLDVGQDENPPSEIVPDETTIEMISEWISDRVFSA